MFDSPPREGRLVSWLEVAMWTMLIYLTIPFARGIQQFITQYTSRVLFSYVVVACILTGTLLGVLYLWRRRADVSRLQFTWLVGTSMIYLGSTYHLRQTPEEALHFIEYGVLGILVFRAFSHRMRDGFIYVCTFLLCTILGTFDEMIQWFTPRRYWDYRDVWLNMTASGLMQIAFAQGIRPRMIVKAVKRESVRKACCLSATELLVLSICVANLPNRIISYAAGISSLPILQKNLTLMTEFGYRHEAPDMGVFFSRFTVEELRQLDLVRAEDGARILDQYQHTERYNDFLRTYTPVTDPFLHELRVHLFRRDHYRFSANRQTNDEVLYRDHSTVAYRENQIVEQFFPRTVAASNYKLCPSEVKKLQEHANAKKFDYVSPVSENLITAYREWHLQALIWGFIAMVFVVHRFCGMRIVDSTS